MYIYLEECTHLWESLAHIYICIYIYTSRSVRICGRVLRQPLLLSVSSMTHVMVRERRKLLETHIMPAGSAPPAFGERARERERKFVKASS